MSSTPTSLWSEYIEKSEQEGHGDGQNIVMKFMERDILSDLTKKGFGVPGRMSLHDTLASQLERIPVWFWKHHKVASC